MAVMECQDVVRFEEPLFDDMDLDRFKTSLLVEGVAVMGLPKAPRIREVGESGKARFAWDELLGLMSLPVVESERYFP